MQTPVAAGRRQNPQAGRLRHTLSIAPARQTGTTLLTWRRHCSVGGWSLQRHPM